MYKKNSIEKNIVLNSGISFFFKISTIFFAFISRYFFIQYLGVEYLGVNAVISNVLSMLSLSEFGLNAAILSRLYVAIANKDETKISSYYFFYKKIYKCIGVSIIVLGILLMPFLHYFIRVEFVNIYVTFILYLLITAQSYFLSTSTIILEAYQQKYFWVIVHYIFYYIIQIVQIILLILFRNYYLYIVINLLFSIIENLIITSRTNKRYPLKKRNLKVIEKKKIFKDCSALFIHKLSGTIVFSTDNLLISLFTNIMITGMYDNYYLIINNLALLVKEIFYSIRGVIGNIVVSKSVMEAYQYFKLLNFGCYFITSFISINCVALFNTFISSWLGENMILPTSVVFLIILNFYLSSMRCVILLYKEARGIFREDMLKAVVEAFLNFFLSIILAIFFGLEGILLATLLSTVLTSCWYEPFLVYKLYFKINVKPYFIEYFIRILKTIILAYIVYQAVNFTPNIIIQFIISILLSLTLLIATNFYKKEFRYYTKYILRRFKNNG